VDWRPIMIGIAILTMLSARSSRSRRQTSNAWLRYSSIANAGFILTGTVALTQEASLDDVLPGRVRFTTIGASRS